MTPKQIIEAIKAERPEINTLFFVGCGASSAEQYPAQYFMDCNARKIRTSFYTANEFNYATPVSLDETAIVIACSLGGTTPETVAAAKLSQEKGAKVIAVTHDGNSPLAKNADYIITDTFHGTIFSIVLKKQFVTIVRESNKQKLNALLKKFSLENRQLRELSELSEILVDPIDFSKANYLREFERKRTVDYLSKVLEE